MMFTALQYGRVGLVTATISSQGAFAAIYAAIGGESLHPLSFVAIAVSAVGTFVLMGARRRRRRRRASAAASCSRSAPRASPGSRCSRPRAAARASAPTGSSTCVRISSVAVVIAAAGRDAAGSSSPRGVVVPMLISGVGEVAAFGAYIAASDRIGVAVPAVIASQFALIAATVGWFVLGERLGRAADRGRRARSSPASRR